MSQRAAILVLSRVAPYHNAHRRLATRCHSDCKYPDLRNAQSASLILSDTCYRSSEHSHHGHVDIRSANMQSQDPYPCYRNPCFISQTVRRLNMNKPDHEQHRDHPAANEPDPLDEALKDTFPASDPVAVDPRPDRTRERPARN